jgi:arginine/lysine/ornithine decarboxylase
MTTPIADFVKNYARRDLSRFHMPGHKGKALLGCESLDITEIDGADVLYSADGIIDESESNASALFGTKHSFYSTEGSSLAIKAMLALIKKRTPAGKRTTVLAARNVHKAFIYACALLDIDAEWLYPTKFSHLCECNITPEELEIALASTDRLPDAVYLTSPDYIGNIADVKGISEVCRRYSLPLLVDNAHGAYLGFCEQNMHPIALGADMCCDSAHKTFPVLTGGAYLHIANSFDADKDEVRSALALFASTSPSYLILQSLDLCNSYLADDYRERLANCIARLGTIKSALAQRGVRAKETEPLKLVLTRDSCGYGGDELAKILRHHGIEPEFADRDAIVLMATPSLEERDFERLERALSTLVAREPVTTDLPAPEIATRALSIRDAIFSPSENTATKDAAGRICASPIVSCPPAVPVVMSGEIITEGAIELMLYYGIDQIDVLK